MNDREAALAEIVDIARRNELSARDIVEAMKTPAPGDDSPGGGIVRRLLAYIGGIFVFASVAVYIGMFWGEMNSAARIIITLGTGIVALTLSILLLDHDRLARAATPLFLIAAWLQPTGIMVAFDELGTGGDSGFCKNGRKFPLSSRTHPLTARKLHAMGCVENNRAAGLLHHRNAAHVDNQVVVAEHGASFSQ